MLVRMLLAVGWAGVGAAMLLHLELRAASSRRARRLALATGRQESGLASRWLRRLAVRRDLLAHRREARAHRREQLAALPVAIDLLALGASASLTPQLALEHAARWAPHAMAETLREVLKRVHLGASLHDSLTELGRRDRDLEPLCSVLTGSVATGAPVADPLRRLAVEHREQARRRSEERARKLSVRLLFPLVLLVLPAFGLLVVVPALVRGLGSVAGS